MELCGEVWVRRQSKDAEEVERPSVLATPPATPVPVKEKPLKTHAEGGPVKEKPLKTHSEAESGASAGPSTNQVLSPADVGCHAADNSIPPQMMNIYPQQEGNVSLCSTLPTHGSQPPKHKLLCGFQVASHSDNKSSAEKTLSMSTSRPHNEAMSSPFAPVTPDKGNGSQDCRFQEVIKLVDQWEKMENMGKPGTLQPLQKELIHSSSKSDATPERASRHHDVEPHAAEPSERNSVQALDSKKKYKRSGKGLGLNKTPRQILKRKRHRPKVIQEGKTTKIPKLSIPKPAGKTRRSNVRKNRAKQNGADTPTSLEGKDADPHNASTPNKEIDLHSKSGRKSVGRSLNFDLEGHPASEVSNVEPQVQETCRGTSTSFSTASTVQLAEGLELVVENTYAGIAFNLNRSLNQMLDDYIKLPEYPAMPTQSHRRITKRENLKDLARRKGRTDGIVMEADNSLPPIYQNEEKHVDSNGKQDVLEEENLQNSTLRGHEHRTNSCSLYFPQVHKKRRTEKGRNERTPDNPVTSPHSKVFTFPHAQTLMALERPRTEHVYSLDRIEITTKKRSKVPIQARNPSSLAAIISCGMPTYENLCENTNAEGSKLHAPHACMQALFADALVKMKTKNRTKKRPIHLLSSIYSNAKQEHGVLSRSYRYFLGKESIQDCQSSSSFQGSISGPLSGEVVAYVDPVDDIVQRLRYLHIDTHQKGITFHEENNLIPYVGGGLIIPYEDALDTAKKRRPRAKVDLDRETHKVWKLLMGKAALDACEGSDMDKEKWWEDERAVFRGRVDSFIARMRLVQGDRCFSQWKGSVVDSVVGVFLTQNVSDHLSSSAFMALAAKFPLRSKGNNEESDAGKVNGAKEDNDECFQTYNDSIKWQERMSGLEQPYQGSRLNHDAKVIEKSELANGKKVFAKNTAWVRAGYSKGVSVDVHGEEGKKGHEIQEKQRNTLYTVATVSTESVNRSLPDIVLSQISVSSENSSDCLIETANQVSSSSDSNSEAEDLTVGSKCSSFDSTSYMELLQIEETTKILESCSNDSGRSFPKGKGGTNDQHTYMISGPLLEKSTEAAGILTLETECAVGLQSISHHSVKQLICTEKEICIEKNSFCQNNLIREITEVSPGQDISHLQLQEEHTAKLQQNDSKADFQAENSKDEAEVQVQSDCYTRQEACSDSANTLSENLEVVKADESNLNDVICSPTKDPTKTASRAKTLKSKSESRKNFDWDSLRRQACLIGAKKERSNDRMDSLDWEAVRHADVNELSQTIRERGMNNVLAERIKELLDRLVRDHGSIDLEWLRDIPPDKAKDYLLSIRGLGPKSVECVRLLTLHHLAFPVDTNVGRICVRLGWVPLQPLPEFLQLHLLELYPVLETIQKYLWPRLCTLDQRTLYELHYQMITFGKVFCTKSKPNCNACPMRGECKHFASAFASARLALPGPEEKSLVISMIPNSSGHNMFFKSMPIPQLKGSQASQERSISGHDSIFKPMTIPELEGSELSQEGTVGINCEPIIEEPATPEPECIETVDSAIENAFYEDPDEIPKIELNLEEFTQNLQNYMQTSKMEPKECDWSNALVALTPEAASIPIPKLKNVSRLRTEHQVYELPDLHPLLEGMDQREPDDPCPYLLAIWTPGETAQSTEPPKTCCDTQVTGKLCDKKVCFACNSAREAQAQTVRGTLLIPCRTAMRGSFPLNGTYFQVNEVFADHDSSCNPIDVPRKWIWNLPRRIVFFGTSIPTIFRGLTTEGIQQCFWRGFVCVRGFDKTTRAPRPLYARLHCPASKAPRNKKTPEEEALLRRSARKT